jgi:hypothetical protein
MYSLQPLLLLLVALSCCCPCLSLLFILFLQEDSISLAEIPPDVLVRVLRQLPLSVRLLECSLVCRTWRAAAAVATDDLQLVPPNGSCAARAFQSWMVQHGSNLKALTILSSEVLSQRQEVQLPFQQLHSLTKLWATDADLLNLPSTADPAGTTGSSSSRSGSSSPLSALASLAELGLLRSSVLGDPGALQYLPALSASLTRLQLADVHAK